MANEGWQLEPFDGWQLEPLPVEDFQKGNEPYKTSTQRLAEQELADPDYAARVANVRRNEDRQALRDEEARREEETYKPKSTADFYASQVVQGANRFAAGLNRTMAIALDTLGANEEAERQRQLGRERASVAERQIEGETSGEEVWNNPTSANITNFIVETGLESTPEMFAALAALPAYVASLAGNIATSRAENDLRNDPNGMDLLKALPPSVVSAYLDRLPLQAIIAGKLGRTVGGRIVAGGALEGGTEFVQSGIEYAGETAGTERGFDSSEAFKQAVLGSIAGAGMGTSIAATAETVRAGVGPLEQKQREQEIDAAVGEPFTDPRTAAQMFSPGRDTVIPQPRNEAFARGAPLVNQGDIDSPLPTDLIQEGKGRAEMDVELSGENDILRKYGAPKAGTEVVIRRGPDGIAESGKVIGTFNVDGFDGLRVQMDDGTTYEELFDDIQRGGASITPLADHMAAPVVEPEAPAVDLNVNQRFEIEDSPSVPGRHPVEGRNVLKSRIRRAESGGNDQAKNPLSSASGRYQFIDSTWAALGGDPARKNDPAEQERVMDLLLDQNETALKRAGIARSAGNLYLAHFLGAGGAVNAHSNPDAPVSEAVQKANPFARGWSNAQLIAWADRKMGGSGDVQGSPVTLTDREREDEEAFELDFPEIDAADYAVALPEQEPEGESYSERAAAQAQVAEQITRDELEALRPQGRDALWLAGAHIADVAERGEKPKTIWAARDTNSGEIVTWTLKNRDPETELYRKAAPEDVEVIRLTPESITTELRQRAAQTQQRTEAEPTPQPQWLAMPNSEEPRRFATRKSAELWAKNNKVDASTIAEIVPGDAKSGFGFVVSEAPGAPQSAAEPVPAPETAQPGNLAVQASGAAVEAVGVIVDPAVDQRLAAVAEAGDFPVEQLRTNFESWRSRDGDEAALQLLAEKERELGIGEQAQAPPAFTVTPARYAKDKVLVQSDDGSGYKTDVAYLAEALGGRWTGRERGYVMSKAAAAKLRGLHAAGFGADIRVSGNQTPTFYHRERGLHDMTTAQALRELTRPAERENAIPRAVSAPEADTGPAESAEDGSGTTREEAVGPPAAGEAADARAAPVRQPEAPEPGEAGTQDTAPDTTGDLFESESQLPTEQLTDDNRPDDPVERAKAILKAGLDELEGKPEAAPVEQEPSKDEAPAGMVPLFDDENTQRQIGWFDPKTGKVQRLEADEATVAEPPAPEYQGANAEGRTTDALRRDSGAVPVRPGGRTRALGIAETLSTHGSAKLVGRRVSHPRELAEVAQVYRNPRYETFRVFFIKGDKIVHATGVSARLPGEAPLLPKDMGGSAGFESWLAQAMQDSEADGYYLLHNHPSGDPTPSRIDSTVTARVATNVPGFLGHVVINSGKYAVINAGGGSKVRELKAGEDALLKPSKPHPLLGAAILRSEQLAQIGKATQRPGYVTLLGTSGKGELRVIVDYPVSELERSPIILMGALRRVQRISGSARLFLVGPQGSLDNKAVRDAFRHDLLTDVVDEAGAFMSSKIGGERKPLPAPFTASAARFVAEEGEPFGARERGLEGAAGRPLAAFEGNDHVETMKKHPDYRAAKEGGIEAAVRLVRDLVPQSMLDEAKAQFGGAIFVPIQAAEAGGNNKIPHALAAALAEAAGGRTSADIAQSNRAFHTGAKAMDRLIARPLFSGLVEDGGSYVIVDDVTVLGGTLAEAANHIATNGGQVVGTALLVNAARNPVLGSDRLMSRAIDRRLGDVVRNDLGIDPSSLTRAEAQYLLGFRDADALRARIAKARGERSARLRAKGVPPLDEGRGSVAEGRNDYSPAPGPLGLSFDSQTASPPRLLAPIRALLDSVGPDGTSQRLGDAIDRFRAIVQDKMLPVLRVQTRIERMLGRELTDNESPYAREELTSGRVGARLDDLTEKHVEPLFEGMREKKVTADELESYLYARHAKERNARISAINPEFKEGEGSGMTDAEAEAIMAAVDESGKREALENLASKVDAMLATALETRVEAGLLSKEEADIWRATYQHYVPLRGQPGMGDEAFVGGVRRQSGMSVRGKESKRAFGRKSRAEDILAHSILQAEEAIIRAEQNRVAQAFLGLARAAPNPNFWRIDKIRRVPVLNKATGQVIYRSESQISAEDAPLTVSAKVDGVEHRVTMNRANESAVRMAAAMRNLDAQQFNMVVRTVGSITRFLSAANTAWNLEFVITNAVRDLQAGSINLTATNIKGIARRTLLDWPMALFAATKGAFGKETGEWGRWYREFKLAGGRTYYNRLDDISDLRRRVERNMTKMKNPLSAKAALFALRDLVDNLNSGVENALRLSVFKNAVGAGLTKRQAASLARNITVNFGRKGSAGPLINSGYMFFNASMQGNVTMLRAMRSKKVQAILAGTVLIGFTLDMLNSLVADDDDDGQSLWDKIPEYQKERNLILFLPGREKPLMMTMAYGYLIFPNLGRAIGEVMRGKQPLEVAANWMTSTLDSFNPIGGNNSFWNFLAPTVLDWYVDLERNENFAGQLIMPAEKQFGPQEPDAQRYWPNVQEHWRVLTEFLTRATGGDDVRPGAIDVSPETLEYLQNQVFGAAGATVARTVDLAAKIASGKEVEIEDVPIARKVVGGKPSWYDKSLFYTRLHEIEQEIDYAKSYAASQDIEGLKALVADKNDVLSLEDVAAGARSEMRDIRKSRREVDLAVGTGEISETQARSVRTRLEEQEREVIHAFNSIYFGTVKHPATAD